MNRIIERQRDEGFRLIRQKYEAAAAMAAGYADQQAYDRDNGRFEDASYAQDRAAYYAAKAAYYRDDYALAIRLG